MANEIKTDSAIAQSHIKALTLTDVNFSGLFSFSYSSSSATKDLTSTLSKTKTAITAITKNNKTDVSNLARVDAVMQEEDQSYASKWNK